MTNVSGSAALSIIRGLGGNEHSGMCRCPAHDDNTASLHVSEGAGKVLIKCFASCSQEAVINRLKALRLWPNNERQQQQRQLREQRQADQQQERKRVQRAQQILRAARVSSSNTDLVGSYLENRGIETVPPAAMQLSAKLSRKHFDVAYPAMVFPIIGPQGMRAAHVTFLSSDGSTKLNIDRPRMTFGQVSGGYIQIGEIDPDKPLIIAEGVETAASVAQITGFPAISAISASNMRNVMLPPQYTDTGSEIIIAADNDDPGRDAAEKLARRLADLGHDVRIAVPERPEGADDGFDWNDALRQADADPAELKRAIRQAPRFDRDQNNRQEPRSGEHEALLEELAQLAPVEYAMRREAAAQQLGIGMKFLDEEIKGRRAQVVTDAAMDNSLQAPQPWPKRVNGARIMARLCSILDRHIVLPKGCNVAIALWVLHAHAHDAARHSPILFINSPTKRCGKTQLLETVSRLVPKPLSAANVTPATIFRAIDRWHPTMLIDETDTFLSDKSELRGILNSGHTRSQAYVVRCVGDDFVPKQFSTWAPKAFAAIGRMHPTLEDRSISIELRRKLKSDQVTRIPRDPNAYSDLLRKCARWAIDHMQELQAANPVLPGELNDRARDNWEPLLAIAEACGGEWPERARDAAVQLSGVDDDDDEDLGPALLKDLKVLFAQGQNLSSQDIAQQLGRMDDRPWPDCHQGKPITTRGIAKLLKPFKVRPRQVKVRGNRVNGYSPKQFDWAFKHYLQ